MREAGKPELREEKDYIEGLCVALRFRCPLPLRSSSAAGSVVFVAAVSVAVVVAVVSAAVAFVSVTIVALLFYKG